MLPGPPYRDFREQTKLRHFVRHIPVDTKSQSIFKDVCNIVNLSVLVYHYYECWSKSVEEYQKVVNRIEVAHYQCEGISNGTILVSETLNSLKKQETTISTKLELDTVGSRIAND